MLDLKFIRENREKVSAAIDHKHEKVDLEKLLLLDEKRRKLIGEADLLKQERNKTSALIPQLKKKGQDPQAELARMKEISDKITSLDNELRDLENQIEYLLLRIPNLPHQSVPIGDNDSANMVVRECGQHPRFDFQPRPHWELGGVLGILGLPRSREIL